LKPKPITEESSNKAIVIAPKLSRRQAKNRNRKRNRQIANLNAALNNQIDVRQDQHLEHRIKQLENRAKRQFKEALVKASKAATIASIAIPVLKDKVTDTTELHQQLDNIYGRKESRKLLGKSTATAGLALRYKNALKVRNSDRSSSPVTPVPTYEAEAYKHRLYFI
jgi:predicted phage-related endonuclease